MKASFNDWVASTRFIVGILFIALEMSSSSVSLAPTLQYNTHLGPAVLQQRDRTITMQTVGYRVKSAWRDPI